MSERVGVEQTPDIETVLAEHSTVATGLGEWCCKCSPGEWRPTAHRSSHVAQALAPVLAAAVREARAAELRGAANALPDATEGPDRIGTATWRPYTRDVYSLAIEEAQGALRDRADRIAVDAPEGGA